MEPVQDAVEQGRDESESLDTRTSIARSNERVFYAAPEYVHGGSTSSW